ncbi:MAG: hypothetical protein WCI18_05295 [Pseudomonadota bacterium]
MQKHKKNLLRILVICVMFWSSSLKAADLSETLTLPMGAVKELTIDSPEGIKVKGNSVHLFQTSESTYKVIALKEGLSVIDPTPISRTQEPILIRVEASIKRDHECQEIHFKCKGNVVSNEVRSIDQIYALNSFVDEKWVDQTRGKIHFGASPTEILGVGVESVSKLPGRVLIVKGNLSKAEQDLIARALSHLIVIFPQKIVPSKYIKISFQFSSDRDDHARDFGRLATKQMDVPPHIGEESNQEHDSISTKIMKIEHAKDFSFVESFTNNNGEYLRVEGQGNVLWDSRLGYANFRVKLKSDSGESEVNTNFQTKFNDRNIIADSTLKGNKNAESRLDPWGRIPIISILFKIFLKKTFDTRSSVSVEIIDNYLQIGAQQGNVGTSL